MILVDTGYFFALVHTRDELHERAAAWATSVSGPLVVTEYVLWETVNALSKPADRSKAHVLVEHIQTRPDFIIVPATTRLTQAGLKLHAERPDKEWSLTDCISFVVMESRGITRALAYDHHFEQAGFVALLRRDPD
jgi:uncharacterized protein